MAQVAESRIQVWFQNRRARQLSPRSKENRVLSKQEPPQHGGSQAGHISVTEKHQALATSSPLDGQQGQPCHGDQSSHHAGLTQSVQQPFCFPEGLQSEMAFQMQETLKRMPALSPQSAPVSRLPVIMPQRSSFYLQDSLKSVSRFNQMDSHQVSAPFAAPEFSQRSAPFALLDNQYGVSQFNVPDSRQRATPYNLQSRDPRVNPFHPLWKTQRVPPINVHENQQRGPFSLPEPQPRVAPFTPQEIQQRVECFIIRDQEQRISPLNLQDIRYRATSCSQPQKQPQGGLPSANFLKAVSRPSSADCHQRGSLFTALDTQQPDTRCDLQGGLQNASHYSPNGTLDSVSEDMVQRMSHLSPRDTLQRPYHFSPADSQQNAHYPGPQTDLHGAEQFSSIAHLQSIPQGSPTGSQQSVPHPSPRVSLQSMSDSSSRDSLLSMSHLSPKGSLQDNLQSSYNLSPHSSLQSSSQLSPCDSLHSASASSPQHSLQSVHNHTIQDRRWGMSPLQHQYCPKSGPHVTMHDSLEGSSHFYLQDNLQEASRFSPQDSHAGVHNLSLPNIQPSDIQFPHKESKQRAPPFDLLECQQGGLMTATCDWIATIKPEWACEPAQAGLSTDCAVDGKMDELIDELLLKWIGGPNGCSE
ncbi:uncharacterized protein [Ambystoma mexicanum]|uniref:uncharacterized protein n=1 Tax=Ambystoma mexicanum TaxID=8296 RepID=UPI0037E837BC